ncbi:MAG: DMT family transporter [Flavitalea sp.]
MKILFYFLPLMAGVAMSIQSGINSQLRLSLQHPFFAAFISFFTGSIALAFILFFSKQSLPDWSVYSGISGYKFLGGLLGVFIVTVALVSVQEIGAANMFVLIVAGQLITAVLMDHFGILGMKTSPINMQKTIGILLLVAGAYIVNKK